MLYGKASRNAEAVMGAHLDTISVWAGGVDGQGWRADQITVETQISWLNPIQTIFPIASGPALIQLTLGDKLTLGTDLVGAVVRLNQCIESFNAVLNKAEAIRTAHATMLARYHGRITEQMEKERQAGRELNLLALLGTSGGDEWYAARVLIDLLTALHTGLIGVPGGKGLCDAYQAARMAFDRGVPI